MSALNATGAFRDNQGRLTLITTGRYSGSSERATLRYVRYGEDFLIIADAKGGKPDWFLNLEEEPIAEAELGDKTLYVNARMPNALERLRIQAFVSETVPALSSMASEKSATILLSPMC